MKRTLSLRRESLTELTTAELAGVNGAAGAQISRPHPVCARLYYTNALSCAGCEA